MSDPTLKPDVVIAGAGPAGLAMALALGGSRLPTPLSVVVLDGRDPLRLREPSNDTRGTALSLATQQMFKALGVFEHLQPHLQEMRHIKVSDGTGALANRASLLSFATDDQVSAAASVVENRHLGAALIAAVEASPAIHIAAGSAISAMTEGKAQMTVRCEDGSNWQAPLVIGADGRSSFVRQASGITATSSDHGQTALTFTIAHQLPHHGTAEEHFSSAGVFALLPLPGDHSSVVWATTPDQACQLMALEPEAFTAALSAEVGDHLGPLALKGGRQAYALRLQVAQSMTANRAALVGDAAHVIHPLAGLGLNLAFKDVACLAECVHDAVGRGEDHGGVAVLERYVQWRRFDIKSTIAAIEGLNLLFANDRPELQTLRRIGLKMVDKLPVAKSQFMQEAAGLSGTLPRLMRGLAR